MPSSVHVFRRRDSALSILGKHADTSPVRAQLVEGSKVLRGQTSTSFRLTPRG